MRRLTAKQRAFVEAYLSNGRNGAEAYRTAYNTKASPQRAADEAYRLLQIPEIARIVAEAERKAEAATQRVMDRYVVTKERIREAVAKLAFFDARDIFEWDEKGGVKLKASKTITDEAAFAITEISESDNGTIKVKLANKLEALLALGQDLGMFAKTSVNVNADLDQLSDHDLIARIRDLAAQLGIEGIDEVLRRLEEQVGRPAAASVPAVR